MAQFDVHERRNGGGLVLDCQAELLSDLSTRFVVPLLLASDAPAPAGRLNPVFSIRGAPHVMVTQYCSAVEVRALGERVTSLAEHDRQIVNALDLLITGV